MISFGFSARHWQQIEAAHPITVSTPLRIGAVFKISAEWLVHGLDRGIYEDWLERVYCRYFYPTFNLAALICACFLFP
jgi:hypothetical protein